MPSLDATAVARTGRLRCGADLDRRVAKLDGLASGFIAHRAAPEALRDHDIARLKAMFGDSFLVLPALARR